MFYAQMNKLTFPLRTTEPNHLLTKKIKLCLKNIQKLDVKFFSVKLMRWGTIENG